MPDASFERQAVRELPGLLSELLDEDVSRASFVSLRDGGADAVAQVGGRRWRFEFKSSSSPGVVAAVALKSRRQDHDAIDVLVVPFMSPAGTRAAAHAELNWIDLSGNARVRADGLLVRVEGRRNRFPTRGRPSSPFAPRSSRVTHVMLLDPERWWRQSGLVEATGLDDSLVSRVVRRLVDDKLLVHRAREYGVTDALRLLDAWSDAYRFERHDIVVGHITGSGLEGSHELHERLARREIQHAFTGLSSAYVIDGFANFRLNTVYVAGDPHEAADAVRLRRDDRGANVQLVGPEDAGVFLGKHEQAGLPLVSPAQTYVDLQHLPERSAEAAAALRDGGFLWPRATE